MNTALSHEKLLSRVETAARLGVSLRKVDYLTASGELTCVKAGRRTLFRMQDIDTYILKNRIVCTENTNTPAIATQTTDFPSLIWRRIWSMQRFIKLARKAA